MAANTAIGSPRRWPTVSTSTTSPIYTSGNCSSSTTYVTTASSHTHNTQSHSLGQSYRPYSPRASAAPLRGCIPHIRGPENILYSPGASAAPYATSYPIIANTQSHRPVPDYTHANTLHRHQPSVPGYHLSAGRPATPYEDEIGSTFHRPCGCQVCSEQITTDHMYQQRQPQLQQQRIPPTTVHHNPRQIEPDKFDGQGKIEWADYIVQF